MSNASDERELVYVIRSVAHKDNRSVMSEYAASMGQGERDITATMRQEVDRRREMLQSFRAENISATASANASIVAATEVQVTRTEQLYRRQAETQAGAAMQAADRTIAALDAQEQAQEHYAERVETLQNRMTHALIGPRGMIMGLGSAIRSFALLGASQDESSQHAIRNIAMFEGVVQSMHALSRVTMGITAANRTWNAAIVERVALVEAEITADATMRGATEAEIALLVEEGRTARATEIVMGGLFDTIGTGTIIMGGLGVVIAAVAAAHYGEQQAAEAQKKAIEEANKAAEEEIKINQERLELSKALAQAQNEYAKATSEVSARAGSAGPEADLKAAQSAKEQAEKRIKDLDEQEQRVKDSAQEERERLGQQLRQDALLEAKGKNRGPLDAMGHVRINPNAGIMEQQWQSMQGFGGTLRDAFMNNAIFHPSGIFGANASLGANANTGATSQANFAAQMEANRRNEAEQLKQIAEMRKEANEAEKEAIKNESDAKEQMHQKSIDDIHKEVEAADKLYNQAREAADKGRASFERDLIRLGSMKEEDKAKLASALNQIDTGDISKVKNDALSRALESGFATPEMQARIHQEQIRRGEADPRFSKFVQDRDNRQQQLEQEANRLRQEEIKTMNRLIDAMSNGDPAKRQQLAAQALGPNGVNAAALGGPSLGKIDLSPLTIMVKVAIEDFNKDRSRLLERDLKPIFERILKDSTTIADLNNQIQRIQHNKSVTQSTSRSS